MENKSKENKMASMPMPALVLNMSLPLMVSLLVQSLYNIVDGIFVARISEKALTATSLAYPMQIMMIAFSVGTSVGINALLSRNLGAKKYDEANRIATTGLILSAAGTVFFMAVGILAAGKFATFFTTDPETALLCKQYLTICMVFCAGIFFETLAQRLLQATGNTTLSMVSLVVGAVTNIILGPIMIFGLFGFPELGIRGAAIATVIGQWLGALVALLLNAFKNPEVKFAFHNYHFTGSRLAAIYKVGFPTIVMQAMGSIMISAVNGILMPFSSTAVAFFGVYYKLQNFLVLPIQGMGQAAIPIVGFNYGAKNEKRMLSMLRVMVPVAVCIMLIGTVLFCAFPAQLLRLFSASDSMLVIGIPALRIISVTFVLTALTTIFGYSMSGLGNGVINMLGTALRQLFLLVPGIWIFSKMFGISYAWYAFWISEGFAALYAVLASIHELKSKNVISRSTPR
ncbi:MAG: MATE family efflux transporter [Lachnospiraceae bacterium]|nr:MATE family efflux transporter [Lachnospiraceae bacterium]